MVAKLAVTGVEFRELGRAQAVDNLKAQNLNAAAFVGFLDQSYNDLGIKVAGAEGNLGKHGDGRVEVASLGQFSPPAPGALLTANEVRSV